MATPSTKIARRLAQNVTASISCRSSHSDASEFCQECHLKASNNEELWSGCDSCSNWYHYTCLGLAGIPGNNYW
uniref:Zinc finger PHD-type domain-containing protein n=1 Tax=Amphimedon queenslandica TaxID=400682 RepID=A0A1X7TH85_AMPQE